MASVTEGHAYRFFMKVENWNDATRGETGHPENYTHVRVDAGLSAGNTGLGQALSVSPTGQQRIERDGQEFSWTVHVPRGTLPGTKLEVEVHFANGTSMPEAMSHKEFLDIER